MIFENYPIYIRQIKQASIAVHPDIKSHIKTILTCAVIGLIISVLTFNTFSSELAHAQITRAITSVDISADNIQVKLETNESDLSTASLLTDKSTNLSPTDAAKISSQIKACLTNDLLTNAKGNIIDDKTFEALITLEDGIPVKVIIKKLDDGSYVIQSVIAHIDPTQMLNKKQEINNPITTQSQKEAFAHPLNNWNIDNLYTLFKIDSNATEEDRASALKKGMSVISNNIVMIIPQDFTEQAEEKTQTSDKDKNDATDNTDTNSNNNTDATNSNINVNTNTNSNINTNDNKNKSDSNISTDNDPSLQYDRITPYIRSYKSKDGSTLSVRAEQLGSAFTSMNGLDVTNKMLEYWQDTATNVAEGAGQKINDENYITEVFYDEQSDMWGYWGRVIFTDEGRNITYNRCVLINEHTKQMITISYRNDSKTKSNANSETTSPDADNQDKTNANNTVMTLDVFKSLFSHAPTLNDSAAGVYFEQLDKIKILAGHEKTIAEEKADMETKSVEISATEETTR